ncbi:retrovirus-related Pol polyprotein from transposon RE1 [Trichonephila clavata]|uniref:Retrovirus-related Pol polyprotein from transposon RE1 n=1 Tax=Trichonephila clavata TaxID=2740835 RepID=A0A8X6H983_TRICU|nr:retrovirus-related Pol polyprotein from transposon RE1 [Trichonephila clavata]
MKQDLEKTETVCFSNFLSKKKLSKVPRNVNTVPGGTTATPSDPSGKTEYQKKDEENKLVETINVRFDEYRKVIDFKPKTNGYPRLDLNFPDYDDEEDDFDTVGDSLASRLVSKTSTETPSTSFKKPDLSSDNRSLIPCSEVKWIRNIGREVTGSNVYYGIEGTATRLRSFNEIERYCNKSNIQYDPSLFDFRKEDTESQEVNMVELDIPNCYKQAIRSREASKWPDAMDREINIMGERKVWDLVDPPDNIKILGNRWVYTVKRDENNKIVR